MDHKLFINNTTKIATLTMSVANEHSVDACMSSLFFILSTKPFNNIAVKLHENIIPSASMNNIIKSNQVLIILKPSFHNQNLKHLLSHN